MLEFILASLAVFLVFGYFGYQWWTARDTDPNRLEATGSLEGSTTVVALSSSTRALSSVNAAGRSL